MQARQATKQTSRGRVLGLAALALTLASPMASATFISFTATGSGTDGALSAQADFTTGDGLLTVTLTNLLDADIIRSAGQGLSDISFVLSDSAGTVGTTTATGQFGNVSTANTGMVTYVSTDSQTGNTTPIRWFANDSIVGPAITLEAIGGGQPSQMIAPSIANGGTYTNVNNGFDNFNAYVIGPATFTLALSGVTASTTILNATFSFGTKPDTFLPGVPVLQQVPEPGVLLLVAMGLVALVGARRRSR
jgi:PEP-CTERM motif-containing protein